MPLTPFCVRVESADDLEFEVNQALAPLLSNRIFGVDIDQSKPGPFFTKNIFCEFSYTTGDPIIPTPFRMRIFDASTEAEALIILKEFIAANPAYFFSEVYFFYRTETPNPNLGVSAAIFYNTTAAAGSNWGGGAASSAGGPAGGDLSGVYPNPTVVGIQGVPISGAPTTSATVLKFNPITAQLEWWPEVIYAATGALAAAGAPYLLYQTVVIYPGSVPAEAGTYQVTSNDGSAFPGDYTKVSDATDTASEVSIIDAGNYYAGNNVEDALQEIGAGLVSGPTGALLVTTNIIDSVAIAVCEGGTWEILLENGTLRYKTMLAVAHDDTNATASEFGSDPGPGVGVLPVTFDADISAGNLRILATATILGWSYRVRRLTLQAI
jgi:hypothetical protein